MTPCCASRRPGDNELHTAALAANAIARSYAACVDALLHQTRTPRAEVRALGAHGQTVRHQPGAFDGDGYTLQLLNAALLAELGGIDVVSDLRSRDVAAGGQGAPLVPAFHDWAFGAVIAERVGTTAVLNLGGMANLSLLRRDGRIQGFDTGPGGALLDAWCQRHLGLPFDDAGAWARSGLADPVLLSNMLAEPYFTQPAPKSTGRDTFNPGWVDRHVQRLTVPIDARHVQATLAELTARSVAVALADHADDARALIVCGGGARNADLIARLQRLAPGLAISTSADHGIPVDQVEALAFAWLAHRFLDAEPGNVPAVTGARGLRRLGALHPAA